MPLVFEYWDPLGIDEPSVTSDLGNAVVRFGALALTQAAELGEASTSGLDIDDPSGALTLAGLRGFTVRETSAPSNNTIVWRGPTGDRKVTRGPSMLTTSARRWSVDLIDQNWSLGTSVVTDAVGKRPAETAGDRLRWWLSYTTKVFVHDYGHVTYPTNAMDACDYRGQNIKDVLADIIAVSGYNAWCEWNEARRKAELFFMDPNSTDYASTLSISNDLADINSTTVFAPSEDAELSRSATRIAYGIYLPYDGGSVYVTNQDTGLQYAFVDQVAPMSNVKSAAKARAVANRLLSDANSEDDRITCSIIVPAASVNALRAGHLTYAKFTHFPGWETSRACRVLRRTVIQDPDIGQDYYRLALELTPVTASTPAAFPWTGSIVVQSDYATENASPGSTTSAMLTASTTYNYSITVTRDGTGYTGYAYRVKLWNQPVDITAYAATFVLGLSGTGGTATGSFTTVAATDADYTKPFHFYASQAQGPHGHSTFTWTFSIAP